MPPEQRAASIVEAARGLLIERGVTFTTRQVAEAAGIAEGTVFRHFDTKDDLIQAVVDDVFDPRPLCAGIDATPPQASLAEAVRHDLALMRGHFHSIGEVMVALHPHRDHRDPKGPPPAGPPGRHHGMNAWYDAVAGSLTHILDRYADSLRIPVDQACAILTSATLVSTHPGPIRIPDFDPARLTDILLNGIGVAHPPTPSAHPQESPCS